jgi:hypothetical protein
MMSRLAELRQQVMFIAAGIGELVPYGGDEHDETRCPECWSIVADGVLRCAGCGYPN